MDERLRRVLRERVEAYLRDVEGLLRGPAPAAAWPAVRVRLLPLAAGWRSLLGSTALACADAAGIAIGRFARFATAARCARCGAPRMPT